jgi:hypothetical protein
VVVGFGGFVGVGLVGASVVVVFGGLVAVGLGLGGLVDEGFGGLVPVGVGLGGLVGLGVVVVTGFGVTAAIQCYDQSSFIVCCP